MFAFLVVSWRASKLSMEFSDFQHAVSVCRVRFQSRLTGSVVPFCVFGRAIFHHIRAIVEERFPCLSCHMMGSFPLKTYLPDSDLDMTICTRQRVRRQQVRASRLFAHYLALSAPCGASLKQVVAHERPYVSYPYARLTCACCTWPGKCSWWTGRGWKKGQKTTTCSSASTRRSAVQPSRGGGLPLGGKISLLSASGGWYGGVRRGLNW